MMFLIAKATTYNINLGGVAKIGALMGAVLVVMTLVAVLVSAFGGKLAITEGDLNKVLPALGCAAVLVLFAAGVAAIISVASSKVTNTKNMWQVAGLMGAVLVIVVVIAQIVVVVEIAVVVSYVIAAVNVLSVANVENVANVKKDVVKIVVKVDAVVVQNTAVIVQIVKQCY